MNPRTLHFVWIGDKDQPDSCLDSWDLPGAEEYELRLWTDRELRGKDWLLKPRMDQMRATGQLCGVADLMRYEILYRYGGITLDADSTAERPIPEWIWDIPNALCNENEVARPGMLALGFMKFERPGHPFLRFLIDQISRIGWQDELPAWQAVGPERLTTEYRKWVQQFNENDIMILPSALFIPNHHSGLEYRGEGAVCRQEWMSTRGKS